ESPLTGGYKKSTLYRLDLDLLDPVGAEIRAKRLEERSRKRAQPAAPFPVGEEGAASVAKERSLRYERAQFPARNFAASCARSSMISSDLPGSATHPPNPPLARGGFRRLTQKAIEKAEDHLRRIGGCPHGVEHSHADCVNQLAREQRGEKL